MKSFIIIIIIGLLPLVQSTICYSNDKVRHNKTSTPTIVDNLYSSVVFISHTKLKSSAKHVISFLTLVGPLVAGHFGNFSSFGIGNLVPGYTEKSIGTGFQTEWGIVTNSHVVGDKQKMVLTTVNSTAYHLKDIEKVPFKDNHSSLDSVKIIKKSSKGAIVYDWGNMDRDLALIRVKVPGAYPLKLATNVKVGDKVFSLGHPKGKKFVPSEIGTVHRIIIRKGIKHLQLTSQAIGGMSGSPLLNIDGEVVGIIKAHIQSSGKGIAVHVEELWKAIGLKQNNIRIVKIREKSLPVMSEPKHWTGLVYSTECTHLYHKHDCDMLIRSDGIIRFETPQEAQRARKLPCNYCKP